MAGRYRGCRSLHSSPSAGLTHCAAPAAGSLPVAPSPAPHCPSCGLRGSSWPSLPSVSQKDVPMTLGQTWSPAGRVPAAHWGHFLFLSPSSHSLSGTTARPGSLPAQTVSQRDANSCKHGAGEPRVRLMRVSPRKRPTRETQLSLEEPHQASVSPGLAGAPSSHSGSGSTGKRGRPERYTQVLWGVCAMTA